MHMSAGGGSRQPSLTGAVQSQEEMEFESTENGTFLQFEWNLFNTFPKCEFLV